MTRVAVVVPVYGNAATLAPLAERLAAALHGHDWRLRLVIDASPDDSAAVAARLAAAEPRIAVTVLEINVGQHRALAQGLADEPGAEAWVCLDADLQDPPEAVPLLLARLAHGDVVDACVRAAVDDALPPGVVLNIGTGVQTSTEELVATAARVTGRPIATEPGAHPGRDWDTADWVCDPTAARRLLGWTPTVDLAEGLARTWAAGTGAGR